ncbi:hypothetical protein HYS47_05080 [Candidatus Woesearchaeota archaeon]|nr:hypothetical protein [Candidatus Woesearchaeota archaeon]
MATEAQIMDQLKTIKQELDYIKENMVDKEMLLQVKQRVRPEYVQKLKKIEQGKFLSEQEFEKELAE